MDEMNVNSDSKVDCKNICEKIRTDNGNISENNETTSSGMSKEIVLQSLDHVENVETPKSFILTQTISFSNENPTTSSRPILLISRPSSLTIQQIPTPGEMCNLPSFVSCDIQNRQPQSLFLQALAKLNESNLSIAIYNHLKCAHQKSNSNQNDRISIDQKVGELSPPDSLASAPPSYSFVLRQMAVRRRPRLMGTFIPSPSFVQHTPPPNYAAAFDIYVDNPLSATPARAYNFGFTSMPVVCPECGYTGMTAVTAKVTLCTHLCAVTLCLFCCWICAPLPYILRSCKDVYHYCRNCRNYLGMYCPTNPENTTYA